MSNICKKYDNTIKYMLLALICILIILDQISKFISEKILSKYITLPIIPSVLHLTYVKNYGAAFGILQNKKFFLILITSIILLAMIIFVIFKQFNNNIFIWSMALIISGGIGNLIDRIVYGYVIDYIDFRLINFAVFNLADSYICIGVFLILFYILFVDIKQEYRNKDF